MFIPGVPHERVPPASPEGSRDGVLLPWRDQSNLYLLPTRKMTVGPWAEPASGLVLEREAAGQHRPPLEALRCWVTEQGVAQPCQWYLAGSLACGSWAGCWVSLLLCMAGAGTTQKTSAGPVGMIQPSKSCLSAPPLLQPPQRNASPGEGSSRGEAPQTSPLQHQTQCTIA